jgi:hypothetical protein
MDYRDLMRDMAETTAHILTLNRRCLEFLAEGTNQKEAGKREGAQESGPEFVNLAGAAKYTTLAKDTISYLARTGKIAVCRTSENGRRIFAVKDLRAYMKSIRSPSAAEKEADVSERADAVLASAGGRSGRRRRRVWKTEQAKESAAGERGGGGDVNGERR